MLSRLQLIQPVLMKPFHHDGHVYARAVGPDRALDAARMARAGPLAGFMLWEE